MDDRDSLVMTPGPTALPPEVREAMARPIENPDIEPAFTEFYRGLLEKLAAVSGTENDVLVLGGEGMLGLEAGVASLVDAGETVLCLSNGLYGSGFADLVSLAGGRPVVLEGPDDEPLELSEVERAVEEHDPVLATMVHCETPTGVLNDLAVLDTLHDAGVITLVDAVSSLAGTSVPEPDVLLGGSQKCLSSPPGLSTLSVSDAAWEKVEETEQRTFYASLEPWRDLGDGPVARFPYTHLVSNLYALDASLDLVLEEGLDSVFERHERAAAHCRERGAEVGLEPYPPEVLCSPTVTAFAVEDAEEVQRRVAEEGVVLATGLDEHTDDILRVGHMGTNAEVEKVDRAMAALETALSGL
jgi:aspartate aminotransferase-like enzyme